MFRDPKQLNVHQLADELALTLVQGLSAKPLSPIGCTLSSAAVRPALRIQDACRRPGSAGFAEGLSRATDAALELHYLCSLGARTGLVATATEDQALHLVKALFRLRKIQRERSAGGATKEPEPSLA